MYAAHAIWPEIQRAWIGRAFYTAEQKPYAQYTTIIRRVRVEK